METLVLEKKCRFCAEMIKAEAIKCKHCGSFVGDYSCSAELAQQIKPNRKDVAILVLLLAVPFIVGGLSLIWYNSLPERDRLQMERLTEAQSY